MTKLESDQDMSQITGQGKENKQYCRLQQVVLRVTSNKRSAFHAIDENVSAQGVSKEAGQYLNNELVKITEYQIRMPGDISAVGDNQTHCCVRRQGCNTFVLAISILDSFLLRAQNYQAGYLTCSCSSTVLWQMKQVTVCCGY